MMDEQQQSALLNAGEKIAGNIPPKSLGEALVAQNPESQKSIRSIKWLIK